MLNNTLVIHLEIDKIRRLFGNKSRVIVLWNDDGSFYLEVWEVFVKYR